MLRKSVSAELTLKKIILFLLVCLNITTLALADHHITRGPNVGEIYFVGPTSTGEGIYYSTDFGETAVCVDSISKVESICADLTSGSLYRIRMPNCLYYSNNYGQYGSWIFRTAEGSYSLASGRAEGEIFKGAGMSSDDYGINFTQHSFNGCFCNVLQSYEIDNQDSIGYYLGSIWGINDTLWLFLSNDNFENLGIQHIFNWNSAYDFTLNRGSEPGELYLLRFAFTGDGSRITELWYSSNFGVNWIFKNHLLSNYIVGGRQPGELFVLAEYMQLMGEIKHIFTYHSLDFGETFTVHHPFAYGPDPYYANFEAEPTTGTTPLTVQFTDMSSGENVQNWEWDFDNDGTIDSYEQNPEYTYQDTGSYSVKLKIYYGPLEDGIIKTNYIQVTENNAVDEELLHVSEIELSNSPNPFNTSTVISYSLPSNIREATIEIYNVKGQLVRNLPICTSSHSLILEVMWNGKDDKGKEVGAGMYFIYMKTGEDVHIKKIVKLGR